jgi:hypothetical protein
MKRNGEVRGACGALLASTPLMAATVAVPLPQQPIGQGRGAVKQGGDRRMGHKLSEKGEKTQGGQRGPFYRGSDWRGNKDASTDFQSCTESKLERFPD